jgi:hypothetical protein
VKDLFEANSSKSPPDKSPSGNFAPSNATRLLENVVNANSSDKILVKDLIDAMNEVGFGLVMMIFAFGFVIPLPPPFPSIISTPLVLFAIQMILGFHAPHLPKRFCNISVKRSTVATLVKKSMPYISKIEKLLRPRLLFMHSPTIQRIVGIFIFIFTSFVLLPIPLSNFIPGLGVLIISFGLLSRDGLVMIAGIIVGISGIIISLSALFFGIGALKYVKNLIF